MLLYIMRKKLYIFQNSMRVKSNLTASNINSLLYSKTLRLDSGFLNIH